MYNGGEDRSAPMPSSDSQAALNNIVGDTQILGIKKEVKEEPQPEVDPELARWIFIDLFIN